MTWRGEGEAQFVHVVLGYLWWLLEFGIGRVVASSIVQGSNVALLALLGVYRGRGEEWLLWSVDSVLPKQVHE